MFQKLRNKLVRGRRRSQNNEKSSSRNSKFSQQTTNKPPPPPPSPRCCQSSFKNNDNKNDKNDEKENVVVAGKVMKSGKEISEIVSVFMKQQQEQQQQGGGGGSCLLLLDDHNKQPESSSSDIIYSRRGCTSDALSRSKNHHHTQLNNRNLDAELSYSNGRLHPNNNRSSFSQRSKRSSRPGHTRNGSHASIFSQGNLGTSGSGHSRNSSYVRASMTAKQISLHASTGSVSTQSMTATTLNTSSVNNSLNIFIDTSNGNNCCSDDVNSAADSSSQITETKSSMSRQVRTRTNSGNSFTIPQNPERVRRARITDSLNWLACHVPEIVLHELLADKFSLLNDVRDNDFMTDHSSNISDYGTGQSKSSSSCFLENIDESKTDKVLVAEKNLFTTNITMRESALLFVDISGFTKLSTLLDVETLSKTINLYFDMITSCVVEFGGDIIKFAGDAIFAEWRYDESEEVKATSAAHFVSLNEATIVAALCGCAITERCSDFFVPTPANLSENDECLLNVHCGLGVGNLIGVHVGSSSVLKMEYLILGDPISQVAKAESIANLGELVASPQAAQILASSGCIPELVDDLYLQRSSVGGDDSSVRFDYTVIARKKYSALVFEGTINISSDLEYIQNVCHEMSITNLEKFRDQVSYYVHPLIRNDEMDINSMFGLNDQTSRMSRRASDFTKSVARERHRAEAELRGVFTLFITPIMETKLTGNLEVDEAILQKLNEIFIFVMKVLKSYKGHMRQFIVDDKGVVLIATFGLRGSVCENMLLKHCMPATLDLHNGLRDKCKVKNKIGATYGQAYCGVVGGVTRHEFAILGPSVNLSARLMANKTNPGILVDDAIRSLCDDSFLFRALIPVKAKGYEKLVPIFEPIDKLASTDNDFIGRSDEFNSIVGQASKVFESKKSHMVLVKGDSGSGKSTLVNEVCVYIHKKPVFRNKYTAAVYKVACYENEQLLPFSIFRKVFLDALTDYTDMIRFQEFQEEEDEDDDFSTLSVNGASVNSALCLFKHRHLNLMKKWEALGYVPTQSEIMQTLRNTANAAAVCSSGEYSVLSRIHRLCAELGYPPEVASVAASRLLGLRTRCTIQNNPKLSDVLKFMTKAFLHLTAHWPVASIFLDDVQWADSLSLSILLELKEVAPNILVLMTENVEASYDGAKLLKICEKSQIKELRAFTFDETRDFLSNRLKCAEKGLKPADSLIEDIFKESAGLPYHMEQVVHDILRHKLVLVDIKAGNVVWNEKKRRVRGISSQRLLNRFDELDKRSRVLISNCAILGSEFSFSDVLRVFPKWQRGLHISMSKEHQETRVFDIAVIEGLLQNAVSKNIIKETFIGDSIWSLKMFNEDQHKVSRKNSSCCSGKEDELILSTHSSGSIMQASNSEYNFDSHSESSISSMDYESLNGDILNELNYTERIYTFTHSQWRKLILSTLLNSRVKDIHKTIALSFEECGYGDSYNNAEDNMLSLKLLHHWKESNSYLKAIPLAIDIGKRFEEWGFSEDSISVYHNVRSLLVQPDKNSSVCKEYETFDDAFGNGIIQELNTTQLTYLVRLWIFTAKCCANLAPTYPEKQMETGYYYNLAYRIFNEIEGSSQIEDRTLVFLIVSGMCLSLKWKVLIDDESRSLEEELVQRFIKESRLHGDPIHIARALALKGILCSQLGRIDKAIAAHKELMKVYNPSEHSTGIEQEYGSDRAAQNFGFCAQWYDLVGDLDSALFIINYLRESILPEISARNIHNTVLILFPAIWVMKQNWDMAGDAKRLIQWHIVSRFEYFYGSDGKHWSRVFWKPSLIVLELQIREGLKDNQALLEHYYAAAETNDTDDDDDGENTNNNNNNYESYEDIEEWVLSEDFACFTDKFESLFKGGRDGRSIVAEICYRLATTIHYDSPRREHLLEKANVFIKESVRYLESETMTEYALRPALSLKRQILKAMKEGDDDASIITDM